MTSERRAGEKMMPKEMRRKRRNTTTEGSTQKKKESTVGCRRRSAESGRQHLSSRIYTSSQIDLTPVHSRALLLAPRCPPCCPGTTSSLQCNSSHQGACRSVPRILLTTSRSTPLNRSTDHVTAQKHGTYPTPKQNEINKYNLRQRQSNIRPTIKK